MDTREYQVGCWRVVPGELRLTREQNGEVQEETLPRKVFEVLLQLVQAPGHTVSRDALVEHVWQGNAAVGNRGITNAIYQLRKLLADGEQEVIRTIAKTGYQLLLPVQPLEQESTSDTPASQGRFTLRWGLISALAIALLVGLSWNWPRTPKPPLIYGKPTPLTYLEGVEETPALSPDGRYLAFMWERYNEPGRLFIQDLTQPNASLRQISFSSDTESSPTWSPDGQKLAFLRVDDSGRCDVWIKTLDTLEEHRITSCVQERFHRALDWSPSGRYLAVIDRVPQQEHSAVFLYDLTTHERRQLTQPSQGQRDNQLAWAHQSDTLAFVRFQGAYWAELHTVTPEGEAQQQTDDRASIHGLSWSRDDQSLVFNSMRDGGHSLWQITLEDGAIQPLYRDLTPFNIEALATPNHYAYVRHASPEYLQVWDGEKQYKIESAGRDLYGSFAPNGDRMAFLSNRSGRFEIWLAQRDGRGARALSHNEGAMELPAWSPDGQRLVAPVSAENGGETRIVLYDLTQERTEVLLQDAHHYRNPTWLADGNRLLVASNRSGSWQIWQLDLTTRQLTQRTENGGLYAQQGNDGALYFTRPNVPGLWKKVGGAPSERVIEELATDDWGNWVITDNGVAYLHRAKDTDELVLWREGERTVQQTFERGSIKIHRSLSIDEQGRLLLTRLGRREANIVTIAPRPEDAG
ncbi:winged helix-turn-helix domain-containing protein [Ferrimonas balearica]|uniref:winged helix-turn-helix domain-containing protein n=1 Tax=Ferrimonas balearica TaxID=44012 RepID=UPI001C998E02|nr:winged helix-turn-helix domain-containing protein [Ferrimonas balearica]MBY5923389.1 winged helix-turn-helix domain-containing protein [Ferrimonas balearica]MBY5995139.1 winged helix-turn-helix domain-containing protein [Ferrimonas balearica]